jgi:hypothetical protein
MSFALPMQIYLLYIIITDLASLKNTSEKEVLVEIINLLITQKHLHSADEIAYYALFLVSEEACRITTNR